LTKKKQTDIINLSNKGREVKVMRTLCYAFDWENTAVCLRLDCLESLFPCFVSYTDIDEDRFEVTIQCRQEDAPSIERRLAEFM